MKFVTIDVWIKKSYLINSEYLADIYTFMGNLKVQKCIQCTSYVKIYKKPKVFVIIFRG